MFRHSAIILLYVAILSTVPSIFCCAQQLGGSPYAADVVPPDAESFQVYDQLSGSAPDAVCVRQCCCRSRWFVRLGVAVMLFGESGVVRANDVVVLGAGIRISDATTFAFDIGYQLAPNWTATFTCGVPPKLDLDGTGPFEGVSYGTTRYAPAVLALQRHFFLKPCTAVYVGGGVNYTMQYETVDGLIQDLDIENNASAVLQLGVERRLSNRFSLFADAKKAFYRTQAFGTSGGAAIRGDVTANPTVLAFGARYDF